MRSLPFGYQVKGDRVVQHPKEQEALTLMRKLRAKGQSLDDIAKALTEKGYKPRQADRWQTRALRQILADDRGGPKQFPKLRRTSAG